MKKNLIWFTELQQQLSVDACVLVTLNLLLGSSPRESGCRMIVSAREIHGSIGGGNLEFKAIQQARDWLAESKLAGHRCETFGLGPTLNQCCGGTVNLHFELVPAGNPSWLAELCTRYDTATDLVLATAIDGEQPSHFVITGDSRADTDVPEAVLAAAFELLKAKTVSNPSSKQPLQTVEAAGTTWWLERIRDQRKKLLLFGAGHVGQEVARLLQRLPFRLSWLDQRPNVFPADTQDFCETLNIDPLQAIADAESGSIYVVMTHSHELDEDICLAVLQRDDFLWLGLIGSDTKRKRFIHRLKQRGVTAVQLQRLVCPIGLSGLNGKQPATIALSLVAQLMMESTWTDANN